MKSYTGEFLIATVFLLLITYTQTIAQSPWIPDPNFGISGVTRVDFAPSYSDFPNDILFLPDNKILTAGKSEGSEGYFISLSQLLSNGQPDVAGFGLGDLVAVGLTVGVGDEPGTVQMLLSKDTNAPAQSVTFGL